MKLGEILGTLILPIFAGGNTKGYLSDPRKILKKHYEAIGGLEKLKAERTIYTEGTVTLEGTGLQGTFKRWEASLIRNREELDLKVTKEILGDNDEFSWVVDGNGNMLIHKDERTLKERKIKVLLSKYEQLNPESPYFNLNFEGVQKLGEIDCYAIRMTNTINDDTTLLLQCFKFLSGKTDRDQT